MHPSASTVVSALSARSAVGQESASTVVCALNARSVVGVQSASTVVCALSARSAVGLHSASTVVGALSARSAVGLQSVSTVVSDLGARSVKAHTCDPTSPQSKHPLLPASVHRRTRQRRAPLIPPHLPPRPHRRRSREEHLLQLPLQHRLVTRRTLRVPAPVPSEQLEPARVTRRVLTRRLERLARRVAA